MIQSIRFLYHSYMEKKKQAGLELPKYFWHWRIFVWVSIILTIIESFMVVVTWILYTPDLFVKDETLVGDIHWLRIALRYFAIPIANTFRSCGAIILTYYLCKHQGQSPKKILIKV